MAARTRVRTSHVSIRIGLLIITCTFQRTSRVHHATNVDDQSCTRTFMQAATLAEPSQVVVPTCIVSCRPSKEIQSLTTTCMKAGYLFGKFRDVCCPNPQRPGGLTLACNRHLPIPSTQTPLTHGQNDNFVVVACAASRIHVTPRAVPVYQPPNQMLRCTV